MDRETRKANLKKLRLPSTVGDISKRKTRQSTRHTPPGTTISNYFLSPERRNKAEAISNDAVKSLEDTTVHGRSEDETNSADLYIKPISSKRAKRTKLDAFLFKDLNNMPVNAKISRKSLNEDDFVLPEKKVKKAPKLVAADGHTKTTKSFRAKKQATIKSAFLRNEQLFAEIAAQHSAADQFDGDEVQLALAISKSEAECKAFGTRNENDIDDEVNLVDGDIKAESIREKLKIYGFRTAEKKDYNTFAAAFLPKINSRKQKSKWANKFTALTLRSSKIQTQKLQESIEKLLNRQFRTKPLNANEKLIPVYKFHSALLKKTKAPKNVQVLQKGDNESHSYELYFVKDLFEVSDLPAGHLLKDWSTIPGRDLTPKRKNQENTERLKVQENIYEDLEEYFCSRKIMNWTAMNSGNEEQQKVLPTADEELKEDCPKVIANISNSSKIIAKSHNAELDKSVDTIEEIQIDHISSDFHDSPSERKKILQLLSNAKSLDIMNVSSCSIKTQATINTTQKTRADSPDLFADSDVETTETDKDDKAEEPVIKTAKDKTCDTSGLDDVDAHIVSYETFSSDEVKNTLISHVNKASIAKEAPSDCSDGIIIDLTQDDIKLINNNKSNVTNNQMKSIMEIDLFAESLPSQEEDSDPIGDNISNSQMLKHLQGNHKEKSDKESEQIFTMSPTIERLEQLHMQNMDDNLILHDATKNQSVYKKSYPVTEDLIIKDVLIDNNTTFRDLCKKYVNFELQQIVDAKEQENDFFKVLPATQSPEKCSNFTIDINAISKRKSISFTAKSPTKIEATTGGSVLSKSLSFTTNNSNISIDLTQNDEDENDIVEIVSDEYDDCVVLSDDEINYSIWQANKVENNQTSDRLHHTNDRAKALESEVASDEDRIIEFPSQQDDNNFSYLPLNDKQESFIKIALGPEDTLSDFEILTSRYATSNSPVEDEQKFDRSEFGILEEYSEPIDSTPTNMLTEVSFLSSPTETAAPMKQYSNCYRNAQKFVDLINNVEKPPTALNDFHDFDEFDHLVRKPMNTSKKPQGVDQLLTGEISFREEGKTPETTTTKTSANTLGTSAQEVKYNGKIYAVRYTCSPKPDYAKYSEAELLRELYNFGIKRLKRKQAVKILEYIYNQTHPIITVESEDATEKREDGNSTLDDNERPCNSKTTINDKISITKSSNDLINVPNEIGGISRKFELRDSCGLEILRNACDLKAELLDEDYILQTNVGKKTSQPLLPFHIAWYNLVCSNQKLHEALLMYEPIDLQEIYLFLKSLGYRYDPKDLKTFFDRRCIIFRYDLTSMTASNGKPNDKNRHVRKSGKTKIAKNP